MENLGSLHQQKRHSREGGSPEPQARAVHKALDARLRGHDVILFNRDMF